MKTNTVYMAESWFNEAQIAFKNTGMRAMKNNPSIDWNNSFRPIEHQYKGWTINDHPDLLRNSEWQQATFNSDIKAMESMDIIIALYDPRIENSDPGVLWELGFGTGIRKPTFVVIPDDCKASLNLMPALGATRILPLSQLEKFNFNNKGFSLYQGSVY